MADNISYRLHDHHGIDIDGDRYYCYMVMSETPPYSPNPPPPPLEDDDEKNFIFTVKYLNFLRPPGRRQSVTLFSQQRIFDRRDFYSDTHAIVTDMFAELPWNLPEALLAPAVLTDEPGFRDAFRAARVLGVELVVGGQHCPGGDEIIEEDYTDDEYEPEIEAQLVSVTLDGDDDVERALYVWRILIGHLYGRVVRMFSTGVTRALIAEPAS